MDFAHLHQTKLIPSPILLPPLHPNYRVSISLRRSPRNAYSYRRSRKTNTCSAASSSDTLVDANRKQDSSKSIVSNKEEEDLKSWMHKNGLPPCKVVFKEKPSYDKNHQPIHYVAASEDLQVFTCASDFCSCFGCSRICYLWVGVISEPNEPSKSVLEN